MKLIKSLYRDSNQFEMEIIGEDVENGEEVYVCKLLPQYQYHFVEGNKPFTLRKSLVDGSQLYTYVEESGSIQLSLFESEE